MNTFKGHRIISDQVGQDELGVVWNELQKVLNRNVPGDIVEFGCYIGTTSLFIRRLLDEAGESSARTLHVYDSFEGLPPKTMPDESPAGTQFAAGALRVSKKELLAQFRAADLTPPVVHKGWFNQLAPVDIPPSIAFAYLDGDFYDSIATSLNLVWPRLSPGAVVLVDDYEREALPGPAKAVHDFFATTRPMPRIVKIHDIAVIYCNDNRQ
ncbi:MAG TPA: TylF/MycF/NovP-related O-methyltransferase [Candidatus Saccharimonadales bacterium]|nr:TylF/MycF/NovP-related O-methyltransferase [Candidatus Saccharimonadales bacterium]